MAARNDDRHKPEGKLTLQIEKFSEFAREAPSVDRLSDAMFIRGIRWQIRAVKSDSGEAHLGLYLHCLPENPQYNDGIPSACWSCDISYTLDVLHKADGNKRFCWKAFLFCIYFQSCGTSCRYKFEELLRPANGWYDSVGDTITIEAHVEAKMPRGFGFDLHEQWRRITKDHPGNFYEPSDNSTTKLILTLDGKSIGFEVNKRLLAMHSDVFRAMFANEDNKECQEGRVEIVDSTPKAIQQMIEYMHWGQLPADFNEEEDADELMKIAGKYNVEPLAVHSEECLMESVTIDNVCARLLFADRYNAHSLRLKCGQVAVENFRDVTKQEEWDELKETNPKMMNKFLEGIVMLLVDEYLEK